MDFPALLSLLLAFFAVLLSALFYFKATETSNAFYDNTYKFTTDMSDLLVRMESGFGERLRHLDEGVGRMQDRFSAQPLTAELAEAQKQVTEEENNLKAKLNERDKAIGDLVQKAQLDGKEKDRYVRQLKAMEEDVHRMQSELLATKHEASILRRQVEIPMESSSVTRDAQRYLYNEIISKVGPRSVEQMSPGTMQRNWARWKADLTPAFLDYFRVGGHIDEHARLTPQGIAFIRETTARYV